VQTGVGQPLMPGKLLISIKRAMNSSRIELLWLVWDQSYHLRKIDTNFHQPLPNMVQRLFADVINDANWFMNIHEQNHP
jgi:hypothetical protein